MSLVMDGACNTHHSPITSDIIAGFTAPKQQELKRVYHPTVYEAMLYSNFWALVVLVGLLFVSGENLAGFHYIFQVFQLPCRKIHKMILPSPML